MGKGIELELRNVTKDEVNDFTISVDRAFGHTPGEDLLEIFDRAVELDRTLIAVEDGRIVANSAVWSMAVTIPGGKQLPMAGVTAVGVSPTHRRKGLLTRMIETIHDQAREREEPVAGLSVSDSRIYGRFGYGPATRTTSVTIQTDRAVPSSSYAPCGEMRLLDPADSFETVKAIRLKYEQQQMGESSRADGLIEFSLGDGPTFRDGDGALELAIHSSNGEDDGYIMFRRSGDFTSQRLPDGKLRVIDQAWLSEPIQADLWRFVIDIDLSETVRIPCAGAVDSAVAQMFAEPRQIQVNGVFDMLWLAILDVSTTLAARTYETSDGLVIAVPMSDGTTQTVKLEGSPKGATCTPTKRDPDVIVPQRWLGSMYLGDQSPIALASLGLIEGEQNKVERLARMFRTPRLPFSGGEF